MWAWVCYNLSCVKNSYFSFKRKVCFEENEPTQPVCDREQS